MKQYVMRVKAVLLVALVIITMSIFAFPVMAHAQRGAAVGGTVRISAFSTSFATSSEGRAHNVMLAASNFLWREVGAGQELSFNDIVGERTEDRGYKIANVINNGVYVEGIGGGVCQVSSTLYCAWIRAGLGVKSVRGHSLPSSYCEMSQDATVSEAIDLILINDSEQDVFINAYTVNRKLVFEIYGSPPQYEIKLHTQILGTIPAGEDIEYVDSLPDGSDYKVVTKPKDGYRTCLIADYCKDGAVVESKVLRNDMYRPTDKKILMVAD